VSSFSLNSYLSPVSSFSLNSYLSPVSSFSLNSYLSPVSSFSLNSYLSPVDGKRNEPTIDVTRNIQLLRDNNVQKIETNNHNLVVKTSNHEYSNHCNKSI
uniref:Uncharacterized protein n=1 Tax=Parascaris univalens TaxID=6257 RepID=A0A915C739_PARUN